MLKSLLTLSTSLSLGLLPLQAQALPTMPYTVTEAPVGLSLEERRATYAEQASDGHLAAAWNLVPFGTGSFLQGDDKGGLTVFLIDILALGLAVSPWVTGRTDWDGVGLLGFALGTFTLGRIMGSHVAHRYADEYNAQLRQELGLDRDLNPLAPQNSQQSPLLFSYSTRF